MLTRKEWRRLHSFWSASCEHPWSHSAKTKLQDPRQGRQGLLLPRSRAAVPSSALSRWTFRCHVSQAARRTRAPWWLEQMLWSPSAALCSRRSTCTFPVCPCSRRCARRAARATGRCLRRIAGTGPALPLWAGRRVAAAGHCHVERLCGWRVHLSGRRADAAAADADPY